LKNFSRALYDGPRPQNADGQQEETIVAKPMTEEQRRVFTAFHEDIKEIVGRDGGELTFAGSLEMASAYFSSIAKHADLHGMDRWSAINVSKMIAEFAAAERGNFTNEAPKEQPEEPAGKPAVDVTVFALDGEPISPEEQGAIRNLLRRVLGINDELGATKDCQCRGCQAIRARAKAESARKSFEGLLRKFEEAGL
jgi:hypothetical protein